VILAKHKVTRCRIVRKRFDDLLSGPEGRRVLCHIEVNQASAMMSKHDQDKQPSKRGGGHSEEIDRDQMLDVMVEETPLGLGRWLASPGQAP
jgi:hypothetical protein